MCEGVVAFKLKNEQNVNGVSCVFDWNLNTDGILSYLFAPGFCSVQKLEK